MRTTLIGFGLAAVLVLVSPASAQEFDIDCALFRGDPKARPKPVALPRMETRTGQEGSVFVGGQIETVGSMFTVGRSVRVTATAAKGGTIQVDATFALAEVIGPNNAPQSSQAMTKTSSIVQSGATIRIELNGEREKHWVEITVSEARR